MRVIVVVAASMLLLVGCTTTSPAARPAATAPAAAVTFWRVVPVNPSPMLVNEQTGETWVYNGANQWSPVYRP